MAPRLAVACALYRLAALLGLQYDDSTPNQELSKCEGKQQQQQRQQQGHQGQWQQQDNGQGRLLESERAVAAGARAVGTEERLCGKLRPAGLEFWKLLLHSVLSDPQLSSQCMRPGGDQHKLQVRRSLTPLTSS